MDDIILEFEIILRRLEQSPRWMKWFTKTTENFFRGLIPVLRAQSNQVHSLTAVGLDLKTQVAELKKVNLHYRSMMERLSINSKRNRLWLRPCDPSLN